MTAPATFPTPTPDDPTPTPTGPFPGPSTTGAAYCPTCLGWLPGWLAGCTKPACRRAELDYDALCARWEDQ